MSREIFERTKGTERTILCVFAPFWWTDSVLPVHVHGPGAARGNGVLMITAGLPRYRAICRDLNELELDRLPCRN